MNSIRQEKGLVKSSLPAFMFNSMSRLLDMPWNLAVSGAEMACIRLLSKIRIGEITIVLANGQSVTYGQPMRRSHAAAFLAANPEAQEDFLVNEKELADENNATSSETQNPVLKSTIHVVNPGFWLRLALFSALGFGEGYMYGDIRVDKLNLLLEILAYNRDFLSDGRQILPANLNAMINNIFTSRIPNSIFNSPHNIRAHYDLGNEMFGFFLDKTMTYSCAIFQNEQESLESAQLRKINAILDKAEIAPGHHLLEIGTGWGALSIEAAKRGCNVTTITLSKEQKRLAEKRILAAGFEDKIQVLYCDYRELDPSKYQFDRIVSVEMLEAVGHEFLATYFSTCEKLLKKPNGIMVFQVITMPEARYDGYLRKTDFIQKHIFPGGHCPSFTAITDAVLKGTNGQLMIDQVENIGPHYVRTLRLWREAFMKNFEKFNAASTDGRVYDEVFRNKWEFYFAYCEAGFVTRTLGDLQIRLTRPNNLDLVAGIPL